MSNEIEREAIKKIWEKQIKGKDTEPAWKDKSGSFVRWSLGKYKEGYTLEVKNDEYPDCMKQYNLKWVKPEEVVEKPKTKKRGRPAKKKEA